MKVDKVNKLSELMGGADPERGSPPTRTTTVESGEGEEKLAEDAQKILDLVALLAGENIFDMQVLVEFCADELRSQIREQVEGED